MTKAGRSGFVVWTCFLAWVSSAAACRYNVRETGFVDLGDQPYFLCFYVDASMPAEDVDTIRRISETVLARSNVHPRVIHVNDQQKAHPALKYLDSAGGSPPVAVLVSPDGQTLAVPFLQQGQSLEQGLRAALKRVLFSPGRKALLEAVAKAYGIVLLLEGPDPSANAEAKKAARAAIEQVEMQLGFMPKPIKHPPELVVIDANSLATEQILLWSMGLEAKDVDEPCAGILYGRARWVGPLFKGQRITEENLASLLFVIGADCECGLDYRWLQGTMLPAKWTRTLHERAVESLGVDPESPTVRMEIVSIVGRGGRRSSYSRALYDQQGSTFEPQMQYREIDVEPLPGPGTVGSAVSGLNDEETGEAPAVEADGIRPALDLLGDEPALHEPNTAQMQLVNLPDPDGASVAGSDRSGADTGRSGQTAPQAGFSTPLYYTALLAVGMFAVVVVLGTVVLVRSRRL